MSKLTDSTWMYEGFCGIIRRHIDTRIPAPPSGGEESPDSGMQGTGRKPRLPLSPKNEGDGDPIPKGKRDDA